MTAVTVVFE